MATMPELINKLPRYDDSGAPAKNGKWGAQNYRNSRKVMSIKGQPILVEDLMIAALGSRSNVLLLGKRGKAKSTLMKDIKNGYFNGNGLWLRMHPKFDEKELFSHLNLGKYFRGEVESSSQLRELLERVHTNCICADELNRAPPITQNRVFGMADGEIDIDGATYPIGKGYSVLIAAANIGTEYKGTFEIDDALIDRFPLIINLDNHSPFARDTFDVIGKKHDPRVPNSNSEDHTELLKQIFEMFQKSEASIIMTIAAQYLEQALGDCGKRDTSKDAMNPVAMQTLCSGCPRAANACNFFTGVSTRTAGAIVGLTLMLQQVAIAKYERETKTAKADSSVTPASLVDNDAQDVLEVFKTVAGYTGIFNATHVMQKHFGNPYLFACEVATAVQQEFTAKMPQLLTLIEALGGKRNFEESMLQPFVNDVSAGSGTTLKNHWRFIGDLI